MEIKLKDFIKHNEIVGFVNFSGSFHKLKNNSKISYVLDSKYHQNLLVRTYLEKNFENFSFSKFQDACRMVLLDGQILNTNMKNLSYTESKRLRFVEALLNRSETIVFDSFEKGFYGRDRSYYQKLLVKLTKYGKNIIYVTNDISFLFGIVKKFILFTEDSFEWIDDFYDSKIYQYVEKPSIVAYIQYLEQKKISMDHYLETKEILKAIYRSVNSRDSL